MLEACFLAFIAFIVWKHRQTSGSNTPAPVPAQKDDWNRDAFVARKLLPPAAIDFNAALSEAYAIEARPLPVIGKNPLEVFRKDKALNDHLDFITEQSARIQKQYAQAYNRYATNRKHVISQRHELIGTLREADRFIADIVALRARSGDVKPFTPVPIPQAPPCETPAELANRFVKTLEAGGGGIARAIGTGTHPVFIGVAAIATVATMVIQFQKSVRKMAEADAGLRDYAARAQTQAAILSRSTDEIVPFSAEIHRIDSEIRQRVLELDDPEIWRRYMSGSCSIDEKLRADRLLELALMAKAYASMAD